jgi:homoserine dehydrogenase
MSTPFRLVQTHGAALAAKAGRPVEISAVSARSRGIDRGVDLSGYGWEDDATRLAARGDVDCVVEVIGGSDGPAKALVSEALAAGKHVVTANKALIAHHGQELAEAAEAAGVALRFEAGVAGGIPVLKAIGEGLAANAISRVFGVLNGTCNYILSEMEATEADYAGVLADAQRLGYAEADPSFDVGGIDAAHKLAILAALAFGTRIDFGGVVTEGIEQITLADIQTARDMGYSIKLLGLARMHDTGLEQRVRPCMVGDQRGGGRGRFRRPVHLHRPRRGRGADRLGDPGRCTGRGARRGLAGLRAARRQLGEGPPAAARRGAFALLPTLHAGGYTGRTGQHRLGAGWGGGVDPPHAPVWSGRPGAGGDRDPRRTA